MFPVVAFVVPKVVIALGVVVGLLAFIVLVVLRIRIVNEKEAVIIARLGKYHRTLERGVNWISPALDRVRSVTWKELKQLPDGSFNYVYRTHRAIPLRERVFDFPNQSVITQDNVTMEINAILFYQVVDPVKAVFEIEDLPDAIEKMTQTTLRNVIGEMDLDDTLRSRDTINSKLKGILDEATDRWGVQVNRVELQDISPPVGIRENMEMQMRAERERRAHVLEAEGLKTAAMLKAEGGRQARISEAEGKKAAIILGSEAEAQARLRTADAEAQAMRVIMEAIGNRGDAVQYLVAMKYIDCLKDIASSPQKTVFLPVEATGVMGSLAGLKRLFEASNDASGSAPGIPPPRMKL